MSPNDPTSADDTLRLDPLDARATDVVLDRDAAPAPPDVAGRLEGVSRVLGLLSAMPEPEPSGDLTERTMRRVAEAGPASVSVNPAAIRPAASATGNVGRQIANSPESPDGV